MLFLVPVHQDTHALGCICASSEEHAASAKCTSWLKEQGVEEADVAEYREQDDFFLHMEAWRKNLPEDNPLTGRVYGCAVGLRQNPRMSGCGFGNTKHFARQAARLALALEVANCGGSGDPGEGAKVPSEDTFRKLLDKVTKLKGGVAAQHSGRNVLTNARGLNSNQKWQPNKSYDVGQHYGTRGGNAAKPMGDRSYNGRPYNGAPGLAPPGAPSPESMYSQSNMMHKGGSGYGNWGSGSSDGSGAGALAHKGEKGAKGKDPFGGKGGYPPSSRYISQVAAAGGNSTSEQALSQTTVLASEQDQSSVTHYEANSSMNSLNSSINNSFHNDHTSRRSNNNTKQQGSTNMKTLYPKTEASLYTINGNDASLSDHGKNKKKKVLSSEKNSSILSITPPPGLSTADHNMQDNKMTQQDNKDNIVDPLFTIEDSSGETSTEEKKQEKIERLNSSGIGSPPGLDHNDNIKTDNEILNYWNNEQTTSVNDSSDNIAPSQSKEENPINNEHTVKNNQKNEQDTTTKSNDSNKPGSTTSNDHNTNKAVEVITRPKKKLVASGTFGSSSYETAVNIVNVDSSSSIQQNNSILNENTRYSKDSDGTIIVDVTERPKTTSTTSTTPLIPQGNKMSKGKRTTNMIGSRYNSSTSNAAPGFGGMPGRDGPPNSSSSYNGKGGGLPAPHNLFQKEKGAQHGLGTVSLPGSSGLVEGPNNKGQNKGSTSLPNPASTAPGKGGSSYHASFHDYHYSNAGKGAVNVGANGAGQAPGGVGTKSGKGGGAPGSSLAAYNTSDASLNKSQSQLGSSTNGGAPGLHASAAAFHPSSGFAPGSTGSRGNTTTNNANNGTTTSTSPGQQGQPLSTTLQQQHEFNSAQQNNGRGPAGAGGKGAPGLGVVDSVDPIGQALKQPRSFFGNVAPQRPSGRILPLDGEDDDHHENNNHGTTNNTKSPDAENKPNENKITVEPLEHAEVPKGIQILDQLFCSADPHSINSNITNDVHASNDSLNRSAHSIDEITGQPSITGGGGRSIDEYLDEGKYNIKPEEINGEQGEQKPKYWDDSVFSNYLYQTTDFSGGTDKNNNKRMSGGEYHFAQQQEQQPTNGANSTTTTTTAYNKSTGSGGKGGSNRNNSRFVFRESNKGDQQATTAAATTTSKPDPHMNNIGSPSDFWMAGTEEDEQGGSSRSPTISTNKYNPFKKVIAPAPPPPVGMGGPPPPPIPAPPGIAGVGPTAPPVPKADAVPPPPDLRSERSSAPSTGYNINMDEKQKHLLDVNTKQEPRMRPPSPTPTGPASNNAAAHLPFRTYADAATDSRRPSKDNNSMLGPNVPTVKKEKLSGWQSMWMDGGDDGEDIDDEQGAVEQSTLMAPLTSSMLSSSRPIAVSPPSVEPPSTKPPPPTAAYASALMVNNKMRGGKIRIHESSNSNLNVSTDDDNTNHTSMVRSAPPTKIPPPAPPDHLPPPNMNPPNMNNMSSSPPTTTEIINNVMPATQNVSAATFRQQQDNNKTIETSTTSTAASGNKKNKKKKGGAENGTYFDGSGQLKWQRELVDEEVPVATMFDFSVFEDPPPEGEPRPFRCRDLFPGRQHEGKRKKSHPKSKWQNWNNDDEANNEDYGINNGDVDKVSDDGKSNSSSSSSSSSLDDNSPTSSDDAGARSNLSDTTKQTGDKHHMMMNDAFNSKGRNKTKGGAKINKSRNKRGLSTSITNDESTTDHSTKLKKSGSMVESSAALYLKKTVENIDWKRIYVAILDQFSGDEIRVAFVFFLTALLCEYVFMD